ncbi:hypothetical protein ACQPZX_31370 [Actinoplanes sp. CA-142083]|uniref:hypothetical protein n=1 Tax=Actinoplanes sp. CA-142083 TaxID=3239903 RepID=UPI003D8A2126
MHGLDLRRKRVALSAVVLVATVVLWVCGLPPRSIGVFAAIALAYWALLDRFDRLLLAGVLLVAEAVPAGIEGLPHPWIGIVAGLVLVACRRRPVRVAPPVTAKTPEVAASGAVRRSPPVT